MGCLTTLVVGAFVLVWFNSGCPDGLGGLFGYIFLGAAVLAVGLKAIASSWWY